MREKYDSAENVGCSKFESGALKLRIQLPWSDRCHVKTHIFSKKLSLINFRGENCVSRGRLPRKEQTRNKQRGCLSFAELH